jgi:hypothetical protein
LFPGSTSISASSCGAAKLTLFRALSSDLPAGTVSYEYERNRTAFEHLLGDHFLGVFAKDLLWVFAEGPDVIRHVDKYHRHALSRGLVVFTSFAGVRHYGETYALSPTTRNDTLVVYLACFLLQGRQ